MMARKSDSAVDRFDGLIQDNAWRWKPLLDGPMPPGRGKDGGSLDEARSLGSDWHWKGSERPRKVGNSADLHCQCSRSENQREYLTLNRFQHQCAGKL
jgi:hypothetical protein